MKELIENIDITSAIALCIGFVSAILSFYIFNKKRTADRHLASLLKDDKRFKKIYFDKISRIKNLNNNTISELTSMIDINSAYELKSLEIKKELLKKEIELLKLEILRERIYELAKELKEDDKKQILDALNQKTVIGQMNYVNSILRQSGSTENIQYNAEK